MDTQFSLPIINPAFELLKRSARFLHLIAAIFISAVAIYLLLEYTGNKLICYSQLIIAAELLILVSIPSFIYAMPLVSLLFRLIEVIILFGNAALLFSDNHSLIGLTHLLFALGFLFLLYREWRIYKSENIDIKHTGITIPNFAKDAEISWSEIKTIIFEYHQVVIETFRHKKIEINLRKGLRIDEKQAIDDFCSQHLVV